MLDHVDVLILGAGPAGSSLATRLGDAGFSVLLVDRKRFPRPKACGEFLSPQCVPILEDLGVADEVLGAGARPIAGMRLHGHAMRTVGHFRDVGRSLLPFAGGGLAVRRETLDLTLLRRAERTPGVDVREGTAVRSLRRGSDGRVIGAELGTPGGTPWTVSARHVVGADGLRSTVAEELGVRRRIPWLDKFALVTRYRGVAELPTAEVHLFPGGYFAAAPVEDGEFSVNLIVDRARLADRSGDWDAFLAAHLERVPEFAERLTGATRVEPVRGVGPLAWTTTRQAVPGAVLVGDACGYVDPITGEGIWFALRGAELLAESLEAALHAPAQERVALGRYVKMRGRVVGPRLFMARMLQRGLRSEGVARRVFGALAARPGLTGVLVSVTGDYVRCVRDKFKLDI